MSENLEFEAIRQLIEKFIARAGEELDQRLTTWPTDLAQNEIHEVLGALLARQVTLATQLADCPPIWNGHVAPLILRAMADVYINLAWLIQDLPDRCKKFIHYGLGQLKLELEHRRSEVETRDAAEGDREYLEVIEDWLNSQRATFLTDVNLGRWSGISTRQMAADADCLDFYNFVYTPFSSCSHSMWHHIARYNLKQCQNPLHRFHYVPNFGDTDIDPDYVYLAGKYLQKTFAAFDDALGIEIKLQSAFNLLCDGFAELGAQEPDTPE